MDRKLRGKVGYHDGLAAEDVACRSYSERGFHLVAKRWRGVSGEVDLIFRRDAGFVFVEVKKAKTFETAAIRLTRKQLSRIQNAASEYIGGEPMGQLTPVRLDLALVDSRGDCSVIENISLT